MEGFEFLGIEINSKTEIEEVFHAVTHNLKSEETINTVATKPAVSPEDYKFQRLDGGTDYSAVITRFTEDEPARLLCRLCAISDDNMTDIFDVDATSNFIPSMIKHCLPVVVEETDTLPKQICWSCLEELDRCYRFHQTVAKAEKQLLALEDETFKTTSDTEMSNDASTSSHERARAVDTTVRRNVLLSSIRPCSVVLSIAEIRRKDNSEANSREKSLNNSKHQNLYPTAGVLDSGTTPASGITPQSTCDSGSTKETGSRSVANETQGEKAEHRVDPPIHDRTHTQERSYRCTTCAKMYKSKHSLSKHNRVHTGKGLYICEYCGKKCIYKRGMIEHRRIHTGERPFKCSKCGKKFSLSSSLKRHTVTVHSHTRDYSCSMCDKSFKILHDKTKHMLVHTGKNQTTLYQCDYCKKSHTRKRYLVRHIKSCKRR